MNVSPEIRISNTSFTVYSIMCTVGYYRNMVLGKFTDYSTASDSTVSCLCGVGSR